MVGRSASERGLQVQAIVEGPGGGEFDLVSPWEGRCGAGSITLQIWLDAQEARRQDENALEQNRLNLIENYVTLCKALGGDATTDQKR